MVRAALRIVVSLLLVLTSQILAQDEDTRPGPSGLTVGVSKTGGAIRLVRDVGAGNKTGEVSIFIASIQEVDASGNKITGGGSHAIQQFNQIPFSSSYVAGVRVLNSEVMADRFELSGNLTGVGAGASVSLTVYIIKTNGTITLDDETNSLTAGQVKFGFEIHAWPFAQTGAYLDIDINVKIPPGRSVHADTQQPGKPARFQLGAGAAVDFSKKVLCGSLRQTLPNSYPMYAWRGANNIVTLRLPRCNTTSSYDPTVDVGYGSDSNTTPTSSAVPAATAPLLAFLVAALLALVRGV